MSIEKLVTEDFVEVSNNKIFTASSHSQLNIVPGEDYDSVLTKVEGYILTPSQRQSLDSTYTETSASNPVVLKDCIPYYYTTEDLGEIKDSVDTFIDLPLIGNTTGDARAVLDEATIYRWNGSAWISYIKTGTLSHTQLTNFNADSDYQHFTLTEKNSFISNEHDHTNLTILTLVSSYGSRQIITSAERGRLPTQDEKDAMVGTSGSVSSSNPFVTNSDPRLNTVLNPYITLGSASSETTFEGAITGTRISTFIAAFDSLKSGGSSDSVKALEVLPARKDTLDAGVYDLNADGLTGYGLVWSENDSLLFESFTPYGAVLKFRTDRGDVGYPLTINSGSSSVTIKGFAFDLNNINTDGIYLGRENSLIENCIFESTESGINSHTAIEIAAENCTIRNCIFKNKITTGILVRAKYCKIENCSFDLLNSSSDAILVEADNCKIHNCSILSGTIEINSGINNTQLSKNYLDAVIDNGVNTRWLQAQPLNKEQAYIGRKRTISTNSSDFIGDTEQVFLDALADPYTTEVEVLEGTYNFSSTVTIPEGKAIRGVFPKGAGQVIINSVSGAAFSMSNNTSLENLVIESTNTPTVLINNKSNVKLKRCIFNLISSDSSDDFGVNASGEYITIDSCEFTGFNGLYLYDSTYCTIISNTFMTSLTSLDSSNLDSCSFIDNYICYGDFNFYGAKLIICGNYFLSGVPTKLNTSDSVWENNYPHPEANNYEGIGSFVLQGDKYLEPYSGSSRGICLGQSIISYSNINEGTAFTLPIKLLARLYESPSYTVKLYWTSSAFSGDVLWKVVCTFEDKVNNVIGAPISNQIISSRSHLTLAEEENITLTFNAYGFAGDKLPTHVSIAIIRLADDTSDTLPSDAYLLGFECSLFRD